MSDCYLCELKSQEGLNIMFEADDIILIETTDSTLIGILKEHDADAADNKASGLIKIMLLLLSRNKPNKRFRFSQANSEHFGIVAEC